MATLEKFLVVTTQNATSINWIEARDAAKYPMMNELTPQKKNYLAQNFNRYVTENPTLGSLLKKIIKLILIVY